MLPANKGLEAVQLAGLQAELGLEVKFELLQWDGPAEIVGESVAVAGAAIHFFVEDAHRAAAIGFGLVERKIGGADQRVGADATWRGDGKANAGSDDGGVPLDQIGAAEDVDQAFGRNLGVVGADHRDAELVTAEATNHVGVAQGASHALCNQLEQLVTGWVPECVVDGFEAIEVDQHDCDRAVRRRAETVEAVLEGNSVSQAGKRVPVSWG